MGYLISLFLSTFFLEDVALATSIAWMGTGKISFQDAFLACFLGISAGDLGLYAFGKLASRFDFIQKSAWMTKHQKALEKMAKSEFLTYSIVISRIVPGTRLPTYLGAGFLNYSVFKFFILTIVSVSAWVLAALLAGHSLHALFMDHWVYSVALFFLGMHFIKSLAPKLTRRWDRKALLHSWRKYAYFEFWPAWFFYIPIVPYYAFLSLKYKSFLTPFYASPDVKHGGLIGESKWDFLKFLTPDDPATLPTIQVPRNTHFMELRKRIELKGLQYPIIVKPDVGQRGFGVRIIKDDFELTEYLLLSDFDLIVQKLSQYTLEAGIFYVRLPTESKGRIFSITDKEFPSVIGDGATKLGDLILQDRRARMIAPVYFERLRSQLDQVPQNGEKIPLAECGNHCQGTIFMNGQELDSEALTARIEQIARQIPNFYFGRFDIRYGSKEQLKKGLDFEIVEVNGSGAEATHIWDARTKLTEAYKTLFHQWRLLFEIGKQVRDRSPSNPRLNVGAFLKECLRVYFRKGSLSVSS